MPDGRVLHRMAGARHHLRYSGRVQYTMAPAIERFADGFIDEVSPADLLFDLREATMLDSTNLGLMARLAARADRDNTGERCTIVSSNEDVTEVLRSMGFEEIFAIVPADPAADEPGLDEEITPQPTSQIDLLRTMLEAHRVLATLDESDASFRAVVDQLEAEMAMLGGARSGVGEKAGARS